MRPYFPWAGLLLLFFLPHAHAQPAPTKPPAEIEKAEELFRSGKVKDALELLEKTAKSNSQQMPPKLTLATWFLQAKRGSEARLMLEQAAAAEPRHPEVLLFNASLAFGEGRFTDAIHSCQAALQFAEDQRWNDEQRKRYSREARLGLTSSFENRSDYSSAKEAILGVLNADAKNGSVRQRLAAILFQLSKPEEAFAELQKAYTDDPALDPPELRMALLWLGKADRAKGEEWLKKAVSLHPKVAATQRAYAVFLLEENKADAASLYLESAIKLDATSRETVALRAMLHRHKKEFLLAEPLLEQLYKDGPSDPFAIGNLAIVLAEIADDKKQKRAIDLADSLVKQNNRSGEAYAILGWCLYRSGKLDDAEKALNISASAGQVASDTAYFMAKVLHDRMKYDEAHRLLKDALATSGAFVYRPEARTLLAELAKKLPPPK